MQRAWILAIAGCFAALVMADSAQAQRYQGFSDNPVGPTVSPYLNLVQPDQFGATNYQSLVRPLIEQGNAINRQGSAINRMQQQFGSGGGYSRGGPRSTGHATFFMNYSHYYSMPSP